MSTMTMVQAYPLVGKHVIVMARRVDNRTARTDPEPFPGVVVGLAAEIVRGYRSPQGLVVAPSPFSGMEACTVITFGRVARVLDHHTGKLLFTERRTEG
jgi:hypothetical protein